MAAGGIVSVVTLSELARDRMIEFFDVTQFRRSMLHQGTDERFDLIRRNIPLLIDVSFAEAANSVRSENAATRENARKIST